MPVTTAQGVELSKQIGATYYIECSSRTQQVKTTNPKKYCVCPNVGVLLPRTARNVTGKYLILQCKLQKRHPLICSGRTNFYFKVLLHWMVQPQKTLPRKRLTKRMVRLWKSLS
ncbi:vesicle-associated protein 1-3-like isoform X3 [Juglans microcarpa x Juglans regia]|uniref:vesicle-associated protein 1-3-like isoform X3 n=1 Tax=Juglans microcarpa x Juglans regia TaxID=2249226 RepID=UPI001B7E7E19|nr:vesicle-associated protein 1-3-like isoform X3 [Juglans microcarpa x Juglans regia]XP_041009129.1 vesicle-associated protein 1-3-like isoform X3 [Juglans microcarpa x Juglans regia]